MASAKKPAAAAKTTAAKKPSAKKAAAPKAAISKVKADPGKTQNAGGTNIMDEINQMKDQASEKARNAADRGKERAAEALDGIGKMIRDSAGTIDDKVGKQYGDYARSAADAVDGFANKVDAQDMDTLVEDARQFVRKSPALAVGAAAAVGFVLARLIRSGRDA